MLGHRLKPSLYSRYYAEACNKWRVLLCDLAPGQNSFKEASQRWRAVGDAVSDLNDPRFEPLTSRTDNVLTTEVTVFEILIIIAIFYLFISLLTEDIKINPGTSSFDVTQKQADANVIGANNRSGRRIYL